MRLVVPLLAALVLAHPQVAGCGGPPPPPPGPAPVPRPNAHATLPAGAWKVEYANGVTEVCTGRADGTAAVVEPVRVAGKAAVNGGSVVMVFDNGRVVNADREVALPRSWWTMAVRM
jgi:hypothetical protein